MTQILQDILARPVQLVLTDLRVTLEPRVLLESRGRREVLGVMASMVSMVRELLMDCQVPRDLRATLALMEEREQRERLGRWDPRDP